MNQGYPRLLGDIGGTNARWAWQASAGAELQDVSVQPCEDSASIQESAANYLLAHGHANPRWAGIGIATVITGDDVRLTNSSWRFSIAAFKQTMGLERCLVVNDFTALAMSLPALKSTDLQALGGGVAVAGATIGLLGPGCVRPGARRVRALQRIGRRGWPRHPVGQRRCGVQFASPLAQAV